MKVFNLAGFDKPARELFEQLVIDELGGIDPTRTRLRNKVNPVSKLRRASMEFAKRIRGPFKACI